MATRWCNIARKPNLLLDDDDGSQINMIRRLKTRALPLVEIDLSLGAHGVEAVATRVRI
jgi:hypothetical protein